MTAGNSSAEGQSRRSPEADTPGLPGLLVGGGDRCSNCGTALAVDQRYCVECGTRRGKPRFALAAVAASAETTPMTRPDGGWSRLSAALAVIAVLLALGVGVLIGNSRQVPLRQPVKVQLTGGTLAPTASTGSGPGSTTTTPAGGSGGTPSKACARGTAGCKNGKQTGNFFGG